MSQRATDQKTLYAPCFALREYSSREIKMSEKKSPTHLIFTAVYLSLAVVTLIPLAEASKTSLLGYKALCSFSPISTIGLILLAAMHILLHKRSIAKAYKNSTIFRR
jgi:hypothetical protein